MARVFLDPGHGGKDPGALENGLKEKDINLYVSLKVGDILKNHNVEVAYSRTTDAFIDLTPRTNMANQFKADRFVSIHCNSFSNPTARGIETFHHGASVKGKSLATAIQNELVGLNLGTPNRGVKTANFTVITKSNMAAVLVELGFISNAQDAAYLKNKQDNLALAVAKGVLKDLGIKYVEKEEKQVSNDKNKPSDWAKKEWDWAKREGYLDGTRPKESITREEMAIVLKRLVDKIG